MFCVFLVVWDFLKYFKFEKESTAFERTKSHPAVRSLGGNRSIKTAFLKSTLPETPPVESAEESASVYGATGRTNARTAPPEQEPGEVSFDLGVTRSKREPHDTRQRAGKIIDPVDSVRRERWYVKYHRPRNRSKALHRSASVKGATGRRSATSAPSELQPRKAGLKWSRRLHNPSLKNRWGIHRQGCTSAVEHHPKRHRPKALQRRAPVRRRHQSEERRKSRYRQGTWTFEGSPESPGQRALGQVNASSKHCVFSSDF